jgi:hypothetical protein
MPLPSKRADATSSPEPLTHQPAGVMRALPARLNGR